MSSSPPTVSIILTSFNHARYLCEAIDSVLNQTFADFELIIWDDASSDNSWQIIKGYQDSRIKAFRNNVRRRGVYGINKAIEEIAQGRYIAIHHSDDVWDTEKLEKQVAYLDTHPNIAAVFSWAEIINEFNEYVPINWFNQDQLSRWQRLNQLFLGENHLNHPSVLIRASCYQEVGSYKFGLAQIGDAEMWSRILLHFDVFVIPEKLTKHRFFSDESNTSGPGLTKSIRTENEWNILRSNYFDIKNEESIYKIFPNLRKFYNPSGCIPRFLIAMACLQECKSHAAWTLGLKTLYELVLSKDTASQLIDFYQFDHHKLIELSGKFDPYAFETINIHIKTFAERDLQITNLQNEVERHSQSITERDLQITNLQNEVERHSQSITERDLQITALVSSRSWRMTKGFRWLGHKARRTKKLLRSFTAGQSLRYVFRTLPLSDTTKNSCKNIIFKQLGFLIKDRTAYQRWLRDTKLEKELKDAKGKSIAASQAPLDLPPGVKRILVIDATTPLPDRDAGSVTAWFFLKAMVELGYSVTFIPSDLKPMGRYTENLRALGVLALTSNDIETIDEFLKQKGLEFDIVFLYRVHTAKSYFHLIKRYAPAAKVVFDTVDLHYLREERAAELSRDPEQIKAAQYTKEVEYEIMRAADTTIVLSQAEEAIVKHEDPNINLHVIPLLLDIPGGAKPFNQRNDIIFIGGFLHQPNIDAIKYFVNDIWPIVSTRLPESKLLVIGSNAPEEVLALEAKNERVKILGFVEDINPYFNQCRLSVAPLRYGAGIKGKIGTSSSFGVPCVATTLAVEGMGLIDGDEVVVADGAAQFAEKVIELYTDGNLWTHVSQNTLDFARRNYSYETGRTRLKELIESLFSPKEVEVLRVNMIGTLSEFIRYRDLQKSEYIRRVAHEKSIIGDPHGFAIEGVCALCQTQTRFHVDFQYSFVNTKGKEYPNWRERLVCRYCELNNRVRAAIHLFQQECNPKIDAKIYVTEQTTPMFAWMKSHYSSVIGSEYLGDKLQPGVVNPDGIRHESLTSLSFDDHSFDFILSFDVLEHIPDYKSAISECFRVLKHGGRMLFSVPFAFESENHIIRAQIRDDGSIEHLMEPEYHGDPVNTDGCLCFYHFGWKLLQEFKDAGFESAQSYFYWSDKFGYLGRDQALFIATKN